ncbi:MAG: hypothetical protein E2P00_01080 [Acidobacteria bacterium]|nr:MAG: hypothetical protein E2P00_01080 [Acidobacteriota bacterium]
MKRVAPILVPFLLAVLGLAMVEGVLRLAGFSREAAPVVLRFGYPNPREMVDLFRPDPRLFWRFRPGSVFDADGEVAINAAGYRGPLPLAGRVAAGLRVVVLGDSVVFGGATAWPQELAVLLRQAWPARQVEVLNFGVPGYTVIQGERQYTDDVRDLKPDVVILAYGWNDHWLAAGGLPDHERSFPSPGRARLTLLLTRLRLVQALNGLLPAGAGPSPAPEAPAPRRVPEGLFRLRLENLARRAREDGAHVMVLGLPSALSHTDFPPYLVDMGFARDAESALADHADYRAAADAAAQAAGATYVDLQPVMNEARARGTDSLFSSDGIHPNPAGQKVLATALLPALQTLITGEEPP